MASLPSQGASEMRSNNLSLAHQHKKTHATKSMVLVLQRLVSLASIRRQWIRFRFYARDGVAVDQLW